jgi:hypothetical protein
VRDQRLRTFRLAPTARVERRVGTLSRVSIVTSAQPDALAEPASGPLRHSPLFAFTTGAVIGVLGGMIGLGGLSFG